ncbi:hypothetical protein GCM10027589_12770 [Actinocorallia lasiicapitis]
MHSAGKARDKDVMAWIAGEKCGRKGLGKPFGEPIELLFVGKADRRGNQPAGMSERFR